MLQSNLHESKIVCVGSLTQKKCILCLMYIWIFPKSYLVFVFELSFIKTLSAVINRFCNINMPNNFNKETHK